MADKKNTNKKSKRQTRNNLFVVLFFTALAVIGIYYGIKLDIFKLNGSERTINLPTIDTKIKSASSGEDFYLSTDIMLILERSKNESYEDIYKAVQEAVAGLDYDRLSTEDFTYIRENISDALSGIIGDDAGMSIHITDYYDSKDPIQREYTGPRKATLPVIR